MNAPHPFSYSDPALLIIFQYLEPKEGIARYALLKLVRSLNPLAYYNETAFLPPDEVLTILKKVASSLTPTGERSLNPLESRLNKLSKEKLESVKTLKTLFSELVPNETHSEEERIVTCALRLPIPSSCIGADKAYPIIFSEYKKAAISPAEIDKNDVQNIDKRLKTMQGISNIIPTYLQKNVSNWDNLLRPGARLETTIPNLDNSIYIQMKADALNDSWRKLLTNVTNQIRILRLHLQR